MCAFNGYWGITACAEIKEQVNCNFILYCLILALETAEYTLRLPSLNKLWTLKHGIFLQANSEIKDPSIL